MAFLIEHTRLWWCIWDIPVFLLLLAIVIVFLVKHRNMKKEQKELEDRLEDLYQEAKKEKLLPEEDRW